MRPHPLPPASPPEIHVAGVLIHALPGRAEAVASAVSALPGTDLRASQSDRLVVVCEGDSGAAILDLIGRMRDLPGVAGVALVYQHAESAAAMNEEIEP